VLNFLFGQVMQAAGGKANPATVRAELQKQLAALRTESEQ
jgi:Asp-tRNA(Asn)/Glu-tRNA(Gln) amidotransferase B subunit